MTRELHFVTDSTRHAYIPENNQHRLASGRTVLELSELGNLDQQFGDQRHFSLVTKATFWGQLFTVKSIVFGLNYHQVNVLRSQELENSALFKSNCKITLHCVFSVLWPRTMTIRHDISHNSATAEGKLWIFQQNCGKNACFKRTIAYFPMLFLFQINSSRDIRYVLFSTPLNNFSFIPSLQ